MTGQLYCAPAHIALKMMAILAVAGTLARGDEIVLRNGARIQGHWMNHQSDPLDSYVIQTEHGAVLTLSASHVLAAVSRSPAEMKYDQVAPGFADTASDHWKMADWCQKRRLRKQREYHLRRVVVLDPDDARAWRALGCAQLGGTWSTRRSHLEAKGYVYYQGRWRLPQEVELLRRQEQTRAAEVDWHDRLTRWRSQLFTARRHEAWQSIAEVRDPLAIRALADLLEKEKLPRLKLQFVRVLGTIDDPRALEILVDATMNNPDEEVFYACVDAIASRSSPAVVKFFAESLKDEDNTRVNRAAIVLRRLGDPVALEPLVDALVTTHYTVMPGSSVASRTSEKALFSLASTTTKRRAGSSMAADTVLIPRQIANHEVLNALVEFSESVNFGFDQRAWTNWLAVYRRNHRVEIDARRD